MGFSSTKKVSIYKIIIYIFFIILLIILYFIRCSCIDGKKNKILISSHPSPLSNTKTSTPFTGSKIFSRCNKALKEFGKEEIDWNVY